MKTTPPHDVVPHRIRCGEIWGGNRGDQLEVVTSGVRASLFSRPCDGGRGGDIYYFSVCDFDLLTRIAIVDIVGHGQAVSAVSQWMYDSLASRMNSIDGSAVLSDLNRLSSDKGETGMATAAVAAFYRTDSRLSVAYAGHNELLMCRHGESDWKPLMPQSSEDRIGFPLGVMEDCQYRQESFVCSPGDKLFLHTDGVVEAMNHEGRQFGTDRLSAVLRMSAGLGVTEIRQAVLDALLTHTGGTFGHDDVTFMAVEITASEPLTVET